MKYYFQAIVILFLLLHHSKLSAQFLFEQKTIAQVIHIEDSLGSVNLGYRETLSNTANFMASKNGDKIFYPLCFKRTNDDFSPACQVIYYYGGKDSIIAAINYSWNIEHYLQNRDEDYVKIQMELDRRDEYLKKYRGLIQYFNGFFGKAEYADELNYELKPNFSGSSLWQDSLKMVFLYITFIPPSKYNPDSKYGHASLNVVVQWKMSSSDLMMYAKNNSEYMDFPASDHSAVFTDGDLQSFIKSNLKYPKDARKNHIRAKVYVTFAVDVNGNVVNAKSGKGIGGGCDEEAVRVINLTSGKWQPATNKGTKVNSMLVVPFDFQ